MTTAAAVFAECPVVAVAISGSTSICEGNLLNTSPFESLLQTDNPANPSFVGIQWFSDTGLSVPVTNFTLNHTSTNKCIPQTINLYAGLICSEQAQPIVAGGIVISIYPEPPAPFQNTDCTLTVSDNTCGGTINIEYLQPNGTWAATPAISPPFNGATAVWRAFLPNTPDANADGIPDCFESGVASASSCPCIAPAPPVAIEDTLFVCDSTPNGVPFAVSTTNGTNVHWYDTNDTFLANGASFIAPVPGQYFARIVTLPDLCLGEPTPFWLLQTAPADASFSYPIGNYCANGPDISPNFVGTVGGTFATIGGLPIDSQTGTISPSIAGVFVVSHTVVGECNSNALQVITIDPCCPNISQPLDATVNICNGTVPPLLSVFEPSIVFDDPQSNFVGFDWFADQALTQPVSSDIFTHSGTNTCLTENRVIYVGLQCNTQNAPIPAGKLTLNIYTAPAPTSVITVGGCSLQINQTCTGNLTIEYLQNNGTWSALPPDATPSEGQTAQWRAYIPNAPDDNADGNPDCLLTGETTAISCNCIPPPAPTAIQDTLLVCAGMLNTQPFAVNVPSGAFLFWSDASNNPVDTGNLFVPTLPGAYFAQAASVGDTCMGGATVLFLVETGSADAGFNYAASAFCVNGLGVLPEITGDTGGTFSASGGLPINAQTGEIVLNTPGTYDITYTLTQNNCPSDSTITLSINNNTLIVDAGTNVSGCVGDTLTLGGFAIGASETYWTGEGGEFADYTALQSGFVGEQPDTLYLYLTAENACGLLFFDSVRVIVREATPINASPDTTITQGQTISLWASGANDYFWEGDATLSCNACAMPTVRPLSTTSYLVSSQQTCRAPTFVTVTVDIPVKIDTLLLPNAFSPNNNQQNDEFKPNVWGDLDLYHLAVYNRWGKLVFETDQLNYGWDGTENGKPSEIGVYVYTISYRFAGSGQQREKKGNLMLVR